MPAGYIKSNTCQPHFCLSNTYMGGTEKEEGPTKENEKKWGKVGEEAESLLEMGQSRPRQNKKECENLFLEAVRKTHLGWVVLFTKKFPETHTRGRNGLLDPFSGS